MRTVAPKLLVLVSCLWLVGCGDGATPSSASQRKELKEWTFMIFLNGHNNLDRYGAININQLETVGSTDDVNFVVQWASAKADTTQRLYVEKDDDTKKVTSPVLEDMPRVDMGDYKELVNFVKWTAEKYPAKHYFIGLWNHGSGWHRKTGELFRDINVDDFTDNRMTTEQVGIAMAEASKALGKKVDILGSDACLMAMLEVNEEYSKYVDVAVASEELIPALGWPYDALAKRWVAKPRATAAEVVTILTEEYQKQYLPGGPGEGLGDVTLSSVDLRKAPALYSAIRSLGETVQKLDAENMAKVKEASEEAQRFDTSDYADLGDFLRLLEEKKIDGLGRSRLAPARAALKSHIISNHVTNKYKLATGIAFWLPTSSWSFDRYQERYRKLRFEAATGWSKTLEKILE